METIYEFGELQINQCSLRLYEDKLGHNVYEILRILPNSIKGMIEPYLNELTNSGYDKGSKEIKQCSNKLYGGRLGLNRKSRRRPAKKSRRKSKRK